MNTEVLFSTYPDLIAVIPVCQNLTEMESLWIDNYRGPFSNLTKLNTDYMLNFSTTSCKWRRLILINVNRYPIWNNDAQYEKDSLVRELYQMTVGFYCKIFHLDQVVNCIIFISFYEYKFMYIILNLFKNYKFCLFLLFTLTIVYVYIIFISNFYLF